MSIDAASLLRKLEPPVRPVGTHPVGAPPRPLEQQGFDELLALVSTGDVRSDRGVRVPDETLLREPLTEEQLERLAAAADLAESSGAQRAVMLIDGRGLVMDIASRHVDGELSTDPASRLVDLDAAVYVAGADEEQSTGPAPFLPGSGFVPPAIARQLEEAVYATPPLHD
ncbi:MAG: hypothetical protein GY715_06995 [Planctomycetes bacterium]|nr:hypothetical protein [Planctomycetota bacterium]